MRAVFLRDDIEPVVEGHFLLEDDRAHHLIKAVRIRVGEEVSLFDGLGTQFRCEVETVQKRKIVLKILDKKQLSREFNIDICLGNPKKEAFESALKNATELGVSKFIPFRAAYSQWDIKNKERAKSVVESALIQSNNPFTTEVTTTKNSLEEVLETFKEYDKVFLASLAYKGEVPGKLDKGLKILILIGPEGGFSDEEEKAFLAHEKVVSLRLPTPILRAPNAVSAATGYIISRFDTV